MMSVKFVLRARSIARDISGIYNALAYDEYVAKSIGSARQA